MRPLGATGITVSAVGLGAGRIGDPQVSEGEVDRLIGAALDAGVTLFDTARSYGLSEERLGRALQGRRDRAVLSTKIGYGIEGVPDWTPRCIELGVEAALRRLHTDCVDIVHLHSCPREVLELAGVVEPLVSAVRAGKVRVAAYSGEGDALSWAIRSGAFGSVQCSVSVVDQGALPAAAEAAARGIGVLAKRPLGNAPWRYAQPPAQEDIAEACRRFRALGLDAARRNWPAQFARFAAFAPGVSAILVGTSSAEHLMQSVAAIAQGPLDAAALDTLHAAFEREGKGWQGRV
ncbi:MAG: aldo/keto reductase [Myxococcales bacterium]